MRDYIILNGVNSNTITGLLISTLPPITKPKIRTQTEEIDGRDGDIITKLGYSAYDKEIEIGLYGGFDIDDVIAYFNSEGTVTFSNEPDKFYNYQILDQIDYNKLIRFKTAKVKMHVQPFKYPLEETPVEITIQTVNGEGEEIDLDNTKEAPMTIALKGNTSQNGTPTPDNPIPIQVVSGDNSIVVSNGTQSASYPITLPEGMFLGWIPNTTYQDKIDKSSGKNSFNPQDFITAMSTHYQETKTINGIEFICLGREGSTTVTYTYELNCKENTQYTLSMKYTSSNCSMQFKYSDGTNSSTFPPASSTITDYSITSALNKTVTGIIVNCYGWYSTGSKLEIAQIMLNEGTTALEYEPYGTGWYLKKEIGKYNLSSTPFSAFNSSSTNTTRIVWYLIGRNYQGDIALCDKLPNNINIWNADRQGIAVSYSTGYVIVRINKSIVGTTEEEINTYLSNNDLIFYSPLATPTYTLIEDNTLIAQLEALANATSFYPATHITQTNDDKPFILNATAFQFGEATVNNEGNIYSKPTLDIEGSGTVGIYLDGNQMFSVDLSNANECIIDTAQLEAYNPSTSELMNRQVTGDYSNFKLNAGDNQIQATGDITKVTISNYTRWL